MVTTAEDYPDALDAAAYAAAHDAPILLTRIKELPQNTLDQLDQMNAQNVWIVGGEASHRLQARRGR